MEKDLYIRFAQIDDLGAIDEIYNQAIDSRISTAHMDYYSRAERESWFYDHSEANYPLFVAVKNSKVVGYGSIDPYRKGRRALNKTALISYFVDRRYHRHGIGLALAEHALTLCPDRGIRNVIAIIMERNVASVNLLQKLGFEKWAYLPMVADYEGVEMGQIYMGINLPGRLSMPDFDTAPPQ